MKKFNFVSGVAQATGAIVGLALSTTVMPQALEASTANDFENQSIKISQRDLSPTVRNKLSTLRKVQIEAAAQAIKRLQASDGYSDFFVDDGRNPWHEAFADSVNNNQITVMDSAKKISATFLNRSRQSRADFFKTFNINAKDGYSDFFVDDGKNPWHESFTDVINANDLRNQATLRASAIKKLNVIKAFEKIRPGKVTR